MPLEFSPVEWRERRPGEKYLDFDEIHLEIPGTKAMEMSRGWSLRHPNTTLGITLWFLPE